MMSLAPQVVSPPPAGTLGEGFLWWYLDLIDERGNGVVLIWSWGLPFLPGRVHARRQNQPESAVAAPSLNLVCYREHQEDFYLLQRLAPESVRWEQSADSRQIWQWGRSRIECSTANGQVTLHAELDVDVPYSEAPLCGTLTLVGSQRGPLAMDAAAPSPHVWCPIVPLGHGEATLQLGARSWNVRGRAYHDRNHSASCLSQLGIDRWVWGRAGDENETWIYYLLWPSATEATPELHLLRHDAQGDARWFAAEISSEKVQRTQRFGMRHLAAFDLASPAAGVLRVATERIVDDGPFYLRSLTRVTLPDGRVVAGMEEAVEPDRIDLSMHRPLVRMRVHNADGPNSFWLPLFCGPREGRWRRLLTRMERRPLP